MAVPFSKDMQTLAQKIILDMGSLDNALTINQVEILCTVLHLHASFKDEVIRFAEKVIDPIIDNQTINKWEDRYY